MREGRQLVRETKRFAAEQRGRSWWHLASTLGVFTAVFSITCTDLPWLARLPASLLVALLQVRLFVIYHDYQHGAILGDSPLAAAFFRVFGILTLVPASIWRHTHDHHHRNNARRFGVDSVGSFPVMTTEEYRLATPRVRLTYVVLRHPLTIAFGYLTVFFFSLTIVPFLTNPRLHKDAILATIIHVGLIILLALTRPDVLFLAIILPSLLGSALGAYLFYAQHTFPGVKLRPGEDWDYVFAALHSSSFMRMSPIMHWFTGNIGYHHVHHLNHRIPFYRLPEAMAAIKELQTPVTTSLWPSDIARCLRLNLWDPEQARFVSFAEARRTRALERRRHEERESPRRTGEETETASPRTPVRRDSRLNVAPATELRASQPATTPTPAVSLSD